MLSCFFPSLLEHITVHRITLQSAASHREFDWRIHAEGSQSQTRVGVLICLTLHKTRPTERQKGKERHIRTETRPDRSSVPLSSPSSPFNQAQSLCARAWPPAVRRYHLTRYRTLPYGPVQVRPVKDSHCSRRRSAPLDSQHRLERFQFVHRPLSTCLLDPCRPTPTLSPQKAISSSLGISLAYLHIYDCYTLRNRLTA